MMEKDSLSGMYKHSAIKTSPLLSFGLPILMAMAIKTFSSVGGYFLIIMVNR